MKESMISKIYSGLEAVDREEKRLELSEQEIEKMYELEDELEDAMDGETSMKFREYLSMYGRKAAIEAEKSFVSGFRTAMRLVLESAEDGK